jgi:Domain of Unknown Function (DUF1259)
VARQIGLFGAVCLLAWSCTFAQTQDDSAATWKPVDAALGRQGQLQPRGEGKAAISGDFVLLANEVNPVIRALRTHGIDVTAVHNHMLLDQPHLYFMHFWSNEDAVKLAQGLHAALDETNSKKPQAK